MRAIDWLILGLFLVPSCFLVALVSWGMVKALRGMSQLNEEAGWKHVGWGIWLTGPWGGPYQEPPEEHRKDAARGRSPAKRARRGLLISLALELLAVLGGAWLAHALGANAIAGGLVGLILFALGIGAVWIVLGGVSLLRELGLRQRK